MFETFQKIFDILIADKITAVIIILSVMFLIWLFVTKAKSQGRYGSSFERFWWYVADKQIRPIFDIVKWPIIIVTSPLWGILYLLGKLFENIETTSSKRSDVVATINNGKQIPVDIDWFKITNGFNKRILLILFRSFKTEAYMNALCTIIQRAGIKTLSEGTDKMKATIKSNFGDAFEKEINDIKNMALVELSEYEFVNNEVAKISSLLKGEFAKKDEEISKLKENIRAEQAKYEQLIRDNKMSERRYQDEVDVLKKGYQEKLYAKNENLYSTEEYINLRTKYDSALVEVEKLRSEFRDNDEKQNLKFISLERVLLLGENTKNEKLRESIHVLLLDLFTDVKLPPEISMRIRNLKEPVPQQPLATNINVAAGGINIQQAGSVGK